MSGLIPELFFNTGREDREAVREVLKARIHCNLSGPLAESRTPLLVYGSMSFYGLDGIREFVKRQKSSFSGGNLE